LDVKSASLHEELSEDVYIEQPNGYVKKGEEHKVYELRKALYGLKEAPRTLFNHMESHFMKEGFKKCPNEQTLFECIEEDWNVLVLKLTKMVQL